MAPERWVGSISVLSVVASASVAVGSRGWAPSGDAAASTTSRVKTVAVRVSIVNTSFENLVSAQPKRLRDGQAQAPSQGDDHEHQLRAPHDHYRSRAAGEDRELQVAGLGAAGFERGESFADVDRGAQFPVNAVDPGVDTANFSDQLALHVAHLGGQRVDLVAETGVDVVDLGVERRMSACMACISPRISCSAGATMSWIALLTWS